MFFIDISMNIEIVFNKKVLLIVCNKKKELKDLDDYVWELNNEIINSVVEVLDFVDELEINLDKFKEFMYKLSYVVWVLVKNEEELK